MPPTITVIAKVDAGVHPVYGLIVKGQEYQYNPADPFPDQLFEQPGAAANDNAPPAAPGKKAR